MRAVPREHFLPPHLAESAYDDGPLPLGHGQTISQPYVVAYMTELLRVAPEYRVLEIGAGSGYQAAVLAQLAREVFTVEIVPPLARSAEKALRALGYDNVAVLEADGSLGWPEHAPFDRIMLTAAPESIPPAVLDQLAIGGRLVAPVGPCGGTQWITVATRTAAGIAEHSTIAVRFVPFTGGG
jgi:protein-L-isoaspartate(D-aspartate) O-methyltransferase